MPQLKNAIGPAVRKLRSQRGWTQDELAAKLQLKGWDCTRSWLAKIEARQVYVKDFELLYFAAVFGKNLDDFFSTLSPQKADPKTSREMKANK